MGLDGLGDTVDLPAFPPALGAKGGHTKTALANVEISQGTSGKEFSFLRERRKSPAFEWYLAPGKDGISRGEVRTRRQEWLS